MGKVTLPTPESNPGVAEWAEVYANDRALREVLNGGVDSENIKKEGIEGVGVKKETLKGEHVSKETLTEEKYVDKSVSSRKTKLTAGAKSATENLVLTEAFQEVPGTKLEVTPAVESLLFVPQVATETEGAGTLTVRITVDGVEVAGPRVATLSAEKAHTIKMEAKRGATALTLKKTSSGYSYFMLAA
jgi:hypothetical protein